ncbi:glycosyltransferase [Lachnoclostridium sp. An181]|uniref:glycosyltransferase n=1 Tax=Lachnoclostridium sp. An181 TaxID=1965575 RepID=UPI000B3741A0|nr:glycosyltransferase [Lachnoclostridium sp. An181]OUP49862.1 hypothetical protein B5F18_06470 [Lachnoclostridium sp. An181]
MKVLITTDLYKPTINGVVTSVLNLKKELVKQGHEVRILTVSQNLRSYREGDVYYMKSLPFRIYPQVRFPLNEEEYMQELIAWAPDVVHSQCEFFTYPYARKIAKATHAALVHTYHTLYEQYASYIPLGKYFGNIFLETWMKRRLKDAKIVVAPTRKVKCTLDFYGVPGEIKVVPSGIRIDRYQVREEKAVIQNVKEELNIPKNAKVILSLGRLGHEKRVDELLEGFAGLLENRKDRILLIVGDGPARENLEKKAEELGISGFVRFAGMVRPEEVRKFYQTGDVFVCASTSETQGLTYIEAMANGLPLVCRQDPCLDGVLENGRNGFAYRTIGEFMEGIEKVLGEEHETMSMESMEMAKKFGTDVFAESILGCYKKAMLKGELNSYEGAAVREKQKSGLKKWSWPRHGYARRIS